jgi:hypothetical protein
MHGRSNSQIKSYGQNFYRKLKEKRDFSKSHDLTGIGDSTTTIIEQPASAGFLLETVRYCQYNPFPFIHRSTIQSSHNAPNIFDHNNYRDERIDLSRTRFDPTTDFQLMADQHSKRMPTAGISALSCRNADLQHVELEHRFLQTLTMDLASNSRESTCIRCSKAMPECMYIDTFGCSHCSEPKIEYQVEMAAQILYNLRRNGNH